MRLRQDGERRGAGRRNTLTHAHAPAGSLLHLPALLLHLLAAALVRIVDRAALVEVISRVGPGRGPKAIGSTTLEAASSSIRFGGARVGGGAPSGPASYGTLGVSSRPEPPRVARSRQGRPEEAHEPSRAKAGASLRLYCP